MPRFSIIIPARNEEIWLPKCLDSVKQAGEQFIGEYEVIVVVNRCTDRTEEIATSAGAVIVRNDSKILSCIRNAGAKVATGEVIVTIDADSRMTPGILGEVDRILKAGKYIGGGAMIFPERWSPGICFTAFFLIAYVAIRRQFGGMFWCYRKDFEAIGGFDEGIITAEDLDFSVRMRRHARSMGKRVRMFTRNPIYTSMSKFDRFGDWHVFLNPRKVIKMLRGESRKDADEYFYDFKR